jgi:hypothetical protein
MATLFKEVNYNLATLINSIDMGLIGLPCTNFLQQRRKLISLVIKDAFLKLKR